MSSVPNYVGTSSQVQGEQDVDYMGPNVREKIAPSLQHTPVPELQPYVEYTSMEPKDQLHHAHQSAQNYQSLQDQLFMSQALDPNFNPGFVPGMMDRPVMLDYAPSDPLTEYAEHELKYNALFNLKVMRAPHMD